MKKILLSATALSLLFAASCKKKDDNGSSNYWTLNGQTHNVQLSSATGPLIGFTDASAAATSYNDVAIVFGGNSNSLPTTNGTYKIVADAVNSDELTITAGNETATTSTSYSSTGSDNMTATVTVNNGKVSISIPSVWVKNDNGSSSADSVKFSGNLIQM